MNSHSYLPLPRGKYLRVCSAAPPVLCSSSLCVPGVAWVRQGEGVCPGTSLCLRVRVPLWVPSPVPVSWRHSEELWAVGMQRWECSAGNAALGMQHWECSAGNAALGMQCWECSTAREWGWERSSSGGQEQGGAEPTPPVHQNVPFLGPVPQQGQGGWCCSPHKCRCLYGSHGTSFPPLPPPPSCLTASLTPSALVSSAFSHSKASMFCT